MTVVFSHENESFESLLKRFRQCVNRDGIKGELRKRRYFVTKGEQGRIAQRKAERKARRRQRNNRW